MIRLTEWNKLLEKRSESCAKARVRERICVDGCVENETTAQAYFSTVTSGRLQTRGAVQHLPTSWCQHDFHGDGGEFSEKEV